MPKNEKFQITYIIIMINNLLIDQKYDCFFIYSLNAFFTLYFVLFDLKRFYTISITLNFLVKNLVKHHLVSTFLFLSLRSTCITIATNMISIPININYFLGDNNKKLIIKTRILKYFDTVHENTRLTSTTNKKCA